MLQFSAKSYVKMWLLLCWLVFKIFTVSCETLQQPNCAEGQLFFTTEMKPSKIDSVTELPSDQINIDELTSVQQETAKNDKNQEICKLCVCAEEIHCIAMPEFSCKYYEKLTNMISGPDNIEKISNENYELKINIETRLFETLNKASQNPSYPSCVPLASQYSDCTKDNICLGCKRCTCNLKGEWYCNTIQLCEDKESPAQKYEPVLTKHRQNYGNEFRPSNFTDRILKALPRKVRSVDGLGPFFQPNNEVVPRTISYTAFTETEETTTAKWTPITATWRPDIDTFTMAKPKKSKTKHNNAKYYDKFKPNEDVEDIVFNDFINPAIQHPHNKAGSNAPDKSQYRTIDDEKIIDVDENVTASLTNDLSTKIVEILDILTNFNPERRSNLNASAYELEMENGRYKIKQHKNQPYEEYFDDDEEDEDSKKYKLKHKIIPFTPPPSDNEIDMYPDFKLPQNTKKSKREIIQDDIDKIDNRTSAGFVNLTTDVETTQIKLIEPLSKIINNKQLELFELRKMKDQLIQFIKTYNKDFTPIENSDSNNTLNVNDDSVYVIQSLDRVNKDNLNEEVLKNHLNQLKRDLYNVVNDIVLIKKQAKLDKVPIRFNDDLKKLIRAMKHYIRKHAQVNGITKVPDNGGAIKYSRRNFLYNPVRLNESVEFSDDINDIMIEITKPTKGSINKDLNFVLSKDALEVLTRIKEQLHPREKTLEEVPVFRLFSNLTENLKGIGNNWNKIIKPDLMDPSEKLPYLKYLYLHICEDISKINNIFAVLVFTDSRKMMSPDKDDRLEIINNLNTGLNQYSDKITNLIKNLERKDNDPNVKLKDKLKEVENITKKENYLVDSVRKFMKKSKDNIISVLQNRKPKGVIAKQILKKRLESVAQKRVEEYENKLKEWQEKLNVVSNVRRKRSMNAVDLAVARRMQHVIPNYLRGKIFPALKGVDTGKGHSKIQNKVHTGYQFNVIPLKKH